MHYASCPFGHAKLESTARYTHVATKVLHSIESPLDRLLVPKKNKKKDEPPK